MYLIVLWHSQMPVVYVTHLVTCPSLLASPPSVATCDLEYISALLISLYYHKINMNVICAAACVVFSLPPEQWALTGQCYCCDNGQSNSQF